MINIDLIHLFQFLLLDIIHLRHIRHQHGIYQKIQYKNIHIILLLKNQFWIMIWKILLKIYRKLNNLNLSIGNVNIHL